MKTVREHIIERIITQLENITVANGYENNIGPGNVYRETPVIEKERVPAISVWELLERRERNQYGGTVRTLRIKIEGIVDAQGQNHPAKVSNSLLGDIETALIIGDMSLDDLIDDIQDISAEITHFPIERQLAGALIDFEIKYTTEWGDPYTSGR